MKRFFKWLLYTLVTLFGVVPLILFVWMNTSNSLDQALRIAHWLAPDKISASGASGALISGGKLEHFKLNLKHFSIEVEDATLDWNLYQLFLARVSVKSVAAQRLVLDFYLPESVEEKTEEPKVPKDLLIPVFLNIRNIDITRGELLNLPGGDIFIDNLNGNFSYNGLSYRLDVKQMQAQNQWYQIDGTAKAKLNTLKPFKIAAQIDAKAQKLTADQPPASYALALNASNSLENMKLDASLTSLGTSAAHQRSLQAQALIQPWADGKPINNMQLKLQRVSLADFFDGLPVTELFGSAQLAPAQQVSKFSANISNQQPVSLAQNGLPIEKLELESTLVQDWRNFNIKQLHLRLPNAGVLQLKARLRLARGENLSLWQQLFASDLQLNADFDNVSPELLNQAWRVSSFDGRLNLTSKTNSTINANIDLKPNSKQRQNYPLNLILDANLQTNKAEFKQLELELNQAKVSGVGKLRFPDYAFDGNLDANFPGLELMLAANIKPTSGSAKTRVKLQDAKALQTWLSHLPIAPSLFETHKLAGSLDFQAAIENGWKSPKVDINFLAQDFSLVQPSADFFTNSLQLKQLQLQFNGELDKLQAAIDARVQGETSTWVWRSRGNLAYRKQQQDWRALVTELSFAGRMRNETTVSTNIQLDRPVAGGFSLSHFSADPGSMTISSTTPVHQLEPIISTVNWQKTLLEFSGDGVRTISSSGRFEKAAWYWVRFFMPELSHRMNAEGNLLLDLDWQIQMQERLNAKLQLKRRSGDVLWTSADIAEAQKNTRGEPKHKIILPKGSSTIASAGLDVINLDISKLNLNVDVVNNQLRATADLDSNLGVLQADFATKLQRSNNVWTWADDAAIAGKVSSDVTKLSLFNRLVMPVGWKISGSTKLRLEFGGSRSNPQASGFLTGEKLIVTSTQHRIGIKDGELDLRLDGSNVKINNIVFKGFGGGSIHAHGGMAWRDEYPVLHLETQIDKLQLSQYEDRRLAFSGQVNTWVSEKDLISTGAVTVDHANIELPDVYPPSLDEDIEVIQINQVQTAVRESKFRPNMDVKIDLDLGDNFVLKGYGANAKLIGKLQAQRNNEELQLFGTINVNQGEIRAYGQWLKVKEGRVTFKGNYSNPSFYVLALRPHLREVQVGVQVSGSALSPNVQLFSQPKMSKEEQLAWLLLGKGGASGAEAAILQQAMLSLVGGKQYGGGTLKNLGVDQLSFQTADDDSSSSITLSKQITDNLYVTYEHAFGDAASVFSLFYDLSSKWTIRLQSSTRQALDFIYTTRFD